MNGSLSRMSAGKDVSHDGAASTPVGSFISNAITGRKPQSAWRRMSLTTCAVDGRGKLRRYAGRYPRPTQDSLPGARKSASRFGPLMVNKSSRLVVVVEMSFQPSYHVAACKCRISHWLGSVTNRTFGWRCFIVSSHGIKRHKGKNSGVNVSRPITVAPARTAVSISSSADARCAGMDGSKGAELALSQLGTYSTDRPHQKPTRVPCAASHGKPSVFENAVSNPGRSSSVLAKCQGQLRLRCWL